MSQSSYFLFVTKYSAYISRQVLLHRIDFLTFSEHVFYHSLLSQDLLLFSRELLLLSQELLLLSRELSLLFRARHFFLFSSLCDDD